MRDITLRNIEMEKLRQQGMTLIAVGKIYGITRERVRQLTTPMGHKRAKMETRQCGNCGGKFEAKQKSKYKTCSKECALVFRRKINGKAREDWTKEDWKKYRKTCNDKTKEYRLEYYKKNIDKILAYRKSEKGKEVSRKAVLKYHLNNREEINKRNRERWHNDPIYREKKIKMHKKWREKYRLK